MSRDHAAAFVRWAAGRRRMAGPRGDVVQLCRWHAPLAGRESSQLPPLRNKRDVRRFASETRGGRDAEAFVAAAAALWSEFCSGLDEGEASAARSVADLDAAKRLHGHRRSVLMMWSQLFGDRAVTAAELCAVQPIREAIGCATGRVDDGITPTMVSRFVRDAAAAGLVCDGWRIAAAGKHWRSKSARFRLSRDQLSTDLRGVPRASRCLTGAETH